MLERFGSSLPIKMRGTEVGSAPQETSSRIHPLQEFAVEADYARGFFDACKKNAKNQLPWLIQKNPGVNRSDLRSQHILGLYDAYQSTLGGSEAKKKFERDWGEQGHYLQWQVESFLPELDSERAEALLHPEKIEPYDVKLAERRARRTLVHLPKEEQPLFSEMSDVTVDKPWRRYTEKVASIGLSTASLFGADAAAGVVAAPVENSHFHSFESANIGFLIAAEAASYGSLIYGIAKHVHANRQLAKEQNITINAGYTIGRTIAESAGASEAASERTSVLSQYGSEFVKDSVWNAAIVAAVSSGNLSVRNALILSTFANLGGSAYELAVAAGAHGVLKAERALYNSRHPFRLGEDEGAVGNNVSREIKEDSGLLGEQTAPAEKKPVTNGAI